GRGLPLGVLRRRELDKDQVAAREARARRGHELRRFPADILTALERRRGAETPLRCGKANCSRPQGRSEKLRWYCRTSYSPGCSSPSCFALSALRDLRYRGRYPSMRVSNSSSSQARRSLRCLTCASKPSSS